MALCGDKGGALSVDQEVGKGLDSGEQSRSEKLCSLIL